MQIAISPCPNDTFAFYSLIHTNIYQTDFLDIEELNRALLAGKYAIAKGSFAIMEKISAQYEILRTGAAIGNGVGPVLVKNPKINTAGEKRNAGVLSGRIALPGENTTAHKLFYYWLSEQSEDNLQVIQMPFFEMIPALQQGSVDAAVLIHEGRFVYAAAGLELVADLGAFWEKKTTSMIPLGCIYAKKSLLPAEKNTFVRELRQSLEISRREYSAKTKFYQDKILPYMQRLAQEKEQRVVEAHVDTYVTPDTLDLGADALKSIDVFREKCL